MGKYNEELQKAGVLLDLSGLKPTSKAVKVQFSGGKRTVIDGPFAEAKEVICGYWIIQVKSREEAIEWAKRIPAEAVEIPRSSCAPSSSWRTSPPGRRSTRARSWARSSPPALLAPPRAPTRVAWAVTATAEETRRRIEALWRIESPKLYAALARLVRDVGLAEELAQDALVAALEQWPESGVPENPGAWLMTTAKHRAIDELRRDKLLVGKHEELARDIASGQDERSAELEARLERDSTRRTWATTCCA